MFKRRAEIELNYSRDLEKLSKLLTSRHKEQKLKVGTLHHCLYLLLLIIIRERSKNRRRKCKRMRIIFSVYTNNAGVRIGKNLHI